jgi:bifunctional DNA primase/polymerase-like protein/AAA domain-containing protein
VNLGSNDTTAHAVEAYERGYVPVPVRPGTKRPFDPNWTTLTYGSAADVRLLFEQEPSNLGIALGSPSGGLVDVDIDHAKGLTAAQVFLRGTTPATGGRVSRPGSHYWYVVDDGLPEGTRKWSHPDRRTLVEMRSTGGQTVVPPSVHPDGERYVWGPEGPWGGESGPARISGNELRSRVGCLALATLLSIEWPTRGGRHDAYLALAGALLAEGYGPNRRVSPVWRELAPGIIAVIVQATHDEEGMQTRIDQSVESTLQKLARGKPTQGWPTLAQHLSEDVVQRCKDFVFGVEEAEGHVRPTSPPDDAYDPYTDVQPSPAPGGAGAAPGAYESEEDDESVEDTQGLAFERMVQQEVLRMEVREEAGQRYRAKQEPEDSEPLVRLVTEVLEAEPERAPRIERVLPWDGTLWLSAQRKTGKTTVLVNLAHSLITGEKFLGECAVVPLEPHQRVAVLNFEVTPAKVAAMFNRRGVPTDRVVQVDLRGKANPFHEAKKLKALGEQLKALNVASVFIDTFSHAFTGDSQNDATQVRAWTRQANTWVRGVVGATDLVVTDHAGWGDNARAAGSSAKEADADHIMHLMISDPKDQNSVRHIRTFGRTDDLVKGELLLNKDTEVNTYREINNDEKQAARADQALADMNRAEDAIRLALLQASEPLRAQELCDLAGETEQGQPMSNRSLDAARQRLVTVGEIVTTRGTGRGTPLLHALNPDYVPDYAPEDDEDLPDSP